MIELLKLYWWFPIVYLLYFSEIFPIITITDATWQAL